MTQKKFPFTNRAISALPAHDPNSASKSTEYSDTTVVGLKLVVGSNGIKRFACRFQLASGRKRYAPIGTFGAIDVAEARRIALEMRAVVDRGGDPLEEHDRLKAMPTFSEFVRNEYHQAREDGRYDRPRQTMLQSTKCRMHKWADPTDFDRLLLIS